MHTTSFELHTSGLKLADTGAIRIPLTSANPEPIGSVLRPSGNGLVLMFTAPCPFPVVVSEIEVQMNECSVILDAAEMATQLGRTELGKQPVLLQRGQSLVVPVKVSEWHESCAFQACLVAYKILGNKNAPKRYDSGDRHSSEEPGGPMVLVYAEEAAPVKLDLFGFDGLAMPVSEAESLYHRLGFAIADAQTRTLRPPDIEKGELFLPHEVARWARFMRRRDQLGEELRMLDDEQRAMLTVAFTRALQAGRWIVKESGGHPCASPADPATKVLLIRLAEEARLIPWSDPILIEANGCYLHIDFSETEVAIWLTFVGMTDVKIEAFAKALPMHLDLEAWCTARNRALTDKLDRQIEDLLTQRIRATTRPSEPIFGTDTDNESEPAKPSPEDLRLRIDTYVRLIAERQEREEALLQTQRELEADLAKIRAGVEPWTGHLCGESLRAYPSVLCSLCGGSEPSFRLDEKMKELEAEVAALREVVRVAEARDP